MIIHLDADAFFASVEQAEDPSLKGRPVGVGGRMRGVVASASYEARRAGVFTPMPTAQALQLCPGLVMVSCDMAKYAVYSERMFAIAQDFTPLVERASIDEGYLEIRRWPCAHWAMGRGSGSGQVGVMRDAGDPGALLGLRAYEEAMGAAAALQARIQAEIGIGVSVGVAANKLVAQIAAKLNKPRALFGVAAGGESAFLAPLDVKWLPGVGEKLGRAFHSVGLRRVADVADASPELVRQVAGGQAAALQLFARGVDDRPVVVEEGEVKSYGRQETFAENVCSEEELVSVLRGMADELMHRVRRDGRTVRTLSVQVRYQDMSEATRSRTMEAGTDLEGDIYPLLGPLLREAWERRACVRLVGLRLSNPVQGPEQGELALGGAGSGGGGQGAGAGGDRRKQKLVASLLDQMRERELPLVRGHSLERK